jgi:hypothetical protein
MPDGKVVLQFRGSAGQPYDLERSFDLEQWESWREVEGAGSALEIVDEDATGLSTRYYRARARAR